MNKNLKKLIKDIRNLFIISIAAVGVYISLGPLDNLLGRKMYNDAYKHLPKEQKIVVDSLIKQKVDKSRLKGQVIVLNTINSNLNEIEEKIKKGDYNTALNIIINTKALFKQIKYIDIREPEAKLLNLRKELVKAVNQKMDESKELRTTHPWWD